MFAVFSCVFSVYDVHKVVNKACYLNCLGIISWRKSRERKQQISHVACWVYQTLCT